MDVFHVFKFAQMITIAQCITFEFKYCSKKIQKQPPRGVLRKRCFENVQQIYRRTPCQSTFSIKLLCNFIEIALRHGCSPVNVLHILRTPFNKNNSGRLPLYIPRILIFLKEYYYLKKMICIRTI